MNLRKISISIYRSIFWNYWSLRFGEFGRNSRIESQVILHKPEGIALGNNVLIKKRCRIEAIEMRQSPGTIRLRIGDNTSIQQGCQIIAAEKITIGKNILIAANVLITDHDHLFNHPTKPPALLRGLKKAAVTIEDGCWLGYGCAILKGVTIGKRSVIGANAVVTKNIPPYSVVVGSPAKVIRKIDVENAI